MKPITILTGPAAAGKNTVGHIYATWFSERCAVIDGDQVRWMLRKPHVAPWDGEEGLRQHRLGVHHACLLAKSFVGEGCEVVILDILWSDLAQRHRDELKGYTLRIVRLMPSWEESLRRLHERSHSITDAEAKWVYETQVALQDFDYSIDNSTLSAEKVAEWLASLPSD
jgi:hypothetical protein